MHSHAACIKCALSVKAAPACQESAHRPKRLPETHEPSSKRSARRAPSAAARRPRARTMRRNLSEGSDDSPRDVQELEATERRLARRLHLLDELKASDVHECSWTGNVRLVAAHLDDAARKGGLRARRDVKSCRKKLRALEKESDTMARKRESLGSDGEASECEIAVCYDDKIDEAREALQAAEDRVESAERTARVDAANLVDASEFGEGYRPVHYAAYAGHAEVVALLLNNGARASEKNAAGCTPLFLAGQQGKASVVECLRRNDPGFDVTRKRDWVDCGDGRALCPLDVCRVQDGKRVPQRAATRDALMAGIEDMVVEAPPPPLLTEGVHGGLEVTWTPDHYEVQTGGLDAPPVHALKVKVVTTDGADPAYIQVIRATAERARVLPGFDRGRVEPGVAYVALCARVSASGASAYSAPSEPVVAAAAVEHEAPSRDSTAQPREPPRVHPKIARARAAMLTNREKRRRVQDLIRAPASSRASPRGAFNSTPRGPAPAPAADTALDLLLLDDDDVVPAPAPAPSRLSP